MPNSKKAGSYTRVFTVSQCYFEWNVRQSSPYQFQSILLHPRMQFPLIPTIAEHSSPQIFLLFSGSDLLGVCLVQLKTDGQAPARRYLFLAFGLTKSSSRKWSEQSFEYFVRVKSFFGSLFILEIHTYKGNELNHTSVKQTFYPSDHYHMFTLMRFCSFAKPCQENPSIVELL